MCLEQIKKTNDHEMHEITQQGQAFTKSHLQFSFPSKIQNHTSEKTRKKILLLYGKKFVKTQFLGAVEFPSIF